MPTPMTLSMPAACSRRSSTSDSTSCSPQAGPNARSMSAIKVHVTPVAASAAASPSPSPATTSASRCPAARWRAGVKNASRWINPLGGAVDDALVREARPVVAARERRLHQPEHAQEGVERVVSIELGRVVSRQRDRVAAGQFDQRCGSHRALDMTMQLHLGKLLSASSSVRTRARSYRRPSSRAEARLLSPDATAIE
jgi:hypothetical protein